MVEAQDPVAVIVHVPRAVVCEVLILKADVAVPSGERVMVGGLSDVVGPPFFTGEIVTVSVMVPEKPARLLRLTVRVVDLPWASHTDGGTPKEKSGLVKLPACTVSGTIVPPFTCYACIGRGRWCSRSPSRNEIRG